MHSDDDEDEDEHEAGETDAGSRQASVDPTTATTEDNADEDGELSVPQQREQQQRNKHTNELVEYSPDELRSVDKDLLNAEIVQLEEYISKLHPNDAVLKEWAKREAEFLNRAKDLESVTNQRDGAKKRYDDLRKVRLEEFMAGFTAISLKLKEMYQVGRGFFLCSFPAIVPLCRIHAISLLSARCSNRLGLQFELMRVSR